MSIKRQHDTVIPPGGLVVQQKEQAAQQFRLLMFLVTREYKISEEGDRELLVNSFNLHIRGGDAHQKGLNKAPCQPIFDLAEDNYGLMYSCFAYLYIILTKSLTFPFACQGNDLEKKLNETTTTSSINQMIMYSLIQYHNIYKKIKDSLFRVGKQS